LSKSIPVSDSLRLKVSLFVVQLRRVYGTREPPFPPKRLFALSDAQTEERRRQIEQYLQCISQDEEMSKSELVTSFLRKAQQDTWEVHEAQVEVHVVLPSGETSPVVIPNTSPTHSVLQAVGVAVGIPDDLLPNFGLFLGHAEGERQLTLVRRLQEFELPFVSVISSPIKGSCLFLRTSYLDRELDKFVMADAVGLKLLYQQAVADIKRGWCEVDAAQKQKLAELHKHGTFEEFLRVAQSLPQYGCVRLDKCECDWPEPDSRAAVRAGGGVLACRSTRPGGQGTTEEGTFRVTRIRSWTVTSRVEILVSGEEGGGTEGGSGSVLELAFEYLVRPDTLRWIKLRTQQAIALSLCLQTMVNEILQQRAGRDKEKMSRERFLVSMSSGGYRVVADICEWSQRPKVSKSPNIDFGERITAGLSLRLPGIKKADNVHSNDAFEGIGEEDL
uniref:PX domain-containing protein n=1 Tax=Petromyzon marinus TaxID=7757 RepID=S4RJ75_PETMA